MRLEPAIRVDLDARDLTVAIVSARFNDSLVAQLRQGAQAAWALLGGRPQALETFEVPGAFELPLACQQLAASARYQAIVALGCIIRGDTPHFDYVAGECARGLMQVGLESGVPVIFGVLTVNTPAQAEERADPSRMNKGRESMEAAVEMALLQARIAAASP